LKLKLWFLGAENDSFVLYRSKENLIMRNSIQRNLIIQMQQEMYDEIMQDFRSMSRGFRYIEDQKRFAFEQIAKYGIRATSKILQMPRRTLQRWCRKNCVVVERCPSWVYEWAARRKKRKEFWARKGY